MHVVAQMGNVEIAILLLSAKLDINTRDNNGWTPLKTAARFGQADVARLLLAETELDVNLSNPLFTAANVGSAKIVKSLIGHRDIQVNARRQDSSTALIISAQKGHKDVVRLLLQHPEVQVNLPNENGSTALTMAAQEGHTAVAKLLIRDPRTDVNWARNDGLTALLLAQNDEIVNLLVGHKALSMGNDVSNPSNDRIPQPMEIQAMIQLMERMKRRNETVDVVKNVTKEMMEKCSLGFEKLNTLSLSPLSKGSVKKKPKIEHTESSSDWQRDYDNIRRSQKGKLKRNTSNEYCDFGFESQADICGFRTKLHKQ